MVAETKMRLCACCGFYTLKYLVLGGVIAGGHRREVVCLRCFTTPELWWPGKRLMHGTQTLLEDWKA